MRRTTSIATIGWLGGWVGGLMGLAIVAGCVDRTPPPSNAPVPQGRGEGMRYEDPQKPLPRREESDERGALPPPPFDDVPIVSQDTPEQREFVSAYESVGRPRMVVFVNRTLEGGLLPVNIDDPVASVERTRRSRGEVTVESRDRRGGDARYSDRDRDVDARGDRETTDRYEAKGDRPNEYRDRVDVYLRPGQYDEAAARQVDYEAIENILTDWLAAGGRTEIVSPVVARQRLTDEQVKDLQSGRPRIMGEVARELDADVLVQVTARPTRQTQRGLEVRLVAEAINVGRGGQSIGRAVVDVPPPLDKPRINKFTRFLARRLMDQMTGSWENARPREGEDAKRPGPPGDRNRQDDQSIRPNPGPDGGPDSGRDGGRDAGRNASPDSEPDARRDGRPDAVPRGQRPTAPGAAPGSPSTLPPEPRPGSPLAPRSNGEPLEGDVESPSGARAVPETGPRSEALEGSNVDPANIEAPNAEVLNDVEPASATIAPGVPTVPQTARDAAR